MSEADARFDASAQFAAAIEPLLRFDPGVRAAFAGLTPPATLRLYDLPPPATSENRFPYVVFGRCTTRPMLYDRLGSGELRWFCDVWSRPQPRSFAQLRAIAPAILHAVLAEDALQLPSFSLGEITPEEIQYLEQPDGQTVHALIEVLFPVDPV